MNGLVYIDEHELLGSNFYWTKREQYNLNQEQLKEVGLTDDRVLIHPDLIEPLKAINKAFQAKFNCRLYIKEGYRSPELYHLIYKYRVEKFGKEMTDKLINMQDMPHADGRAVDVALIDKDNKEVYLRDGKDGPEALMADFYKNREDEAGRRYQKLQEEVINSMQENGFRLGKLREYFHFNYRPEEPLNYL